MAKQDDKSDRSTRRVYKSSDVHRRRVGDSVRSNPAKMPSKREVRESARESTRIAAESRIDRAGKTEPAVDESIDDRLPDAEAVKRLVKLDEETGEMTVNGKKVKRVLVDGKEVPLNEADSLTRALYKQVIGE